MYITSIHLLNFKSFKTANIRLSKSINILVGKNNSGKSSIIRSVYQLQHSRSISEDDIRKGENKCKIIIGINEIINKDLSSFVDTKENYEVTDSIVAIKTLNKNITAPPQDSIYYPATFIQEISASGEIKFTPEKETSYGLRKFSGFTNNERENNFIYPFLTRRNTNLNSRQFDDKESYDVSEEFSFILSKIKRITSAHPKMEAFYEQCLKIMDFRISTVQQDKADHLGIYLSDGDPISINQMGSGIVHIAGMIAMLLSDNNKLYIIEELENDLHPEALKGLLDLILSKATTNQFIISTHSNIVLKYLGASKDCKIFETEMKFVASENDPDIKLPTSLIKEVSNEPKTRLALLRKLGYEAFDFEIFEGYIIFEESTAESIVRQFIIPWFVPGLEGRIKTIPSKGVGDIKGNLHDLLRLFVYIDNTPLYHAKAWVITDGDPAGITTLEDLTKNLPGWPVDHFIALSQKNFEDYYPDEFKAEKQAINDIKDPNPRKGKKVELIKKVIEWCYTDKDKAKVALEQSAAEVIEKLKDIERQLNSFN